MNYVYSYHKYSIVDEGTATWENWIRFSPKEIEIFLEVVSNIKEIRNRAKENYFKK